MSIFTEEEINSFLSTDCTINNLPFLKIIKQINDIYWKPSLPIFKELNELFTERLNQLLKD